MKSRRLITAICLGLASAAYTGTASAHGAAGHAAADAQMKRLHEIMPMFSTASAKLEQALERRDAVAIERESGRIVDAIPDLKRSRPHKHLKQTKKFVVQAESFEQSVKTVAVLAKKGDFAGARAAFAEIESQCAACHAHFRD